ncbi:glycosyltransferase family 4 protein [Metallosphaera tengchongensis]|uniref:Glycosyltransferase family 4 protein n=1 Tax=Metallosphaera tengchongensis TaxID=1532350 RepID=A0A6N0NTK2_9CREN|nr:glycosyltransferase family 4 protein [Metallosphaera tengchongensis]QKQ99446.1 glycosyltransferase family 4 protein [Metallosphaera tengchongensis]
MDLLFVNHRDIYHPHAGGAEEVLFHVTTRLSKTNEVTWLTERVKGRSDEEEIDGVRVLRRGTRISLHLLSLLEARRHEVVVDSVAHAVPFFSYLVNERSVALVHHVHQDVLKFEVDPITRLAISSLEKNLKNYSHVIAVSHATKRDLVKKIKVEEDKIKVIHNGVDHVKYRPGKKSSSPLVLWVGRMKRYKNPLDSVEIFKRLNKKAEMVVVGEGDLENEFRRAAEPLGVKYLGRVSEQKKIELYQRAWVVLSTSFIEGWGMTIVEANACGTPALAYNVGSMPEIIKEGKNGFLIDYKDYVKASKTLEYMLEEDVMLSLSKSSLEESMNYDWDRTANEYETYLRSI